MRKYLTVFGMSFQNELTYRFNFILWRVRNVIRILMIFFLWNSVFSNNQIAFGYSKEQMMAYVFAVLIISAFVAAAPSNDNVGGEISSGDLSNYLVKPIGYLKLWLTRDWASKLLNLSFATIEIAILYQVLRPQIILSSSIVNIASGLILCVLAALMYFLITKLAVMVAFWAPENTWGMMFMFYVILEILGGSIFPLDILPKSISNLIQFTPFPYMIYYPIAAFVGKLSTAELPRIIGQSLIWVGMSLFLVKKMWRLGLKDYSATGK